MGFDLDRVLQEVDQDLICIICNGVLETPVQLPLCQHVFCRSCIERWLSRNSHCPVDRQQTWPCLIIPAPRALRNAITRLTIRCENYNNGCDQTFRIDAKLMFHTVVCEFRNNRVRQILCPEGCGHMMPRSRLNMHVCIATIRARIHTTRRKIEELRLEVARNQLILDCYRREITEMKAFILTEMERDAELSNIAQNINEFGLMYLRTYLGCRCCEMMERERQRADADENPTDIMGHDNPTAHLSLALPRLVNYRFLPFETQNVYFRRDTPYYRPSFLFRGQSVVDDQGELRSPIETLESVDVVTTWLLPSAPVLNNYWFVIPPRTAEEANRQGHAVNIPFPLHALAPINSFMPEFPAHQLSIQMPPIPQSGLNEVAPRQNIGEEVIFQDEQSHQIPIYRNVFGSTPTNDSSGSINSDTSSEGSGVSLSSDNLEMPSTSQQELENVSIPTSNVNDNLIPEEIPYDSFQSIGAQMIEALNNGNVNIPQGAHIPGNYSPMDVNHYHGDLDLGTFLAQPNIILTPIYSPGQPVVPILYYSGPLFPGSGLRDVRQAQPLQMPDFNGIEIEELQESSSSESSEESDQSPLNQENNIRLREQEISMLEQSSVALISQDTLCIPTRQESTDILEPCSQTNGASTTPPSSIQENQNDDNDPTSTQNDPPKTTGSDSSDSAQQNSSDSSISDSSDSSRSDSDESI